MIYLTPLTRQAAPDPEHWRQRDEEVSVLKKKVNVEDDPIGIWDPPCPEW